MENHLRSNTGVKTQAPTNMRNDDPNMEKPRIRVGIHFSLSESSNLGGHGRNKLNLRYKHRAGLHGSQAPLDATETRDSSAELSFSHLCRTSSPYRLYLVPRKWLRRKSCPTTLMK